MKPENPVKTFPLGIIDLGAHSARLEIYQQGPEGLSGPLESLDLPVHLGQDVFAKGAISSDSIETITAIMKDFRIKMREYGVKKYRAIATSAVREAQNKDIFVDRIRSVCNIRMEILETCRESRLMYLALKNDLKDELKLDKHDVFYLTLGAGSSNVAFSRNGNLLEAKMFNFGTMRLREEAIDSGNTTEYLKGLIDTFAESLERLLAESRNDKKADREPHFVCAGAVVRLLLGIVNRNRKVESDFISLKELNELTDKLGSGKKYRVDASNLPIPFLEESAELSLQLIRQICCDFGFTGVHAAKVSTRQALVEDMIRDLLEEEDPFLNDMISAALAIGAKYDYEDDHAANVSKLSMKIYEATRFIHRLEGRCGILLHIAAILHDIGRFVDPQKHHKHSFYLISNSQMPGLSEEESAIVALVARYHRKAEPKTSHPDYMQLSSESKVVVCKLAAILRVADALDRGHHGKFTRSKIKISRGKLLIEAPDKYGEYSLERIFLKKKQGMFTSIFSLKPEIN